MLATYKDLLDRQPGLKSPNADEIAKMDRALGAADAVIAVYCGLPRTTGGIFTFEAADYQLHLPPMKGRARIIDHGLRWVIEVQAAYVDDDLEYGPSTEVAEADLHNASDRGWLMLKSGSSPSAWSYEPLANRIELEAGFDCTPDVDGYSTGPADLVTACVVTARHLLDGGFVQGVESFTAGGQSTSLDTADAGALVPRAARMVLDLHYRLDPPYPLRELGGSHGRC